MLWMINISLIYMLIGWIIWVYYLYRFLNYLELDEEIFFNLSAFFWPMSMLILILTLVFTYLFSTIDKYHKILTN